MQVTVIKYESNGDKNENLSIKEYLEEIKPNLKNIINDLQKSDTWKIQLTIAINFISSKDIGEESIMHLNNGNIAVMAYDKADEVIEEYFESCLYRCEVGLETSVRGSDFLFDDVYLLHYKCHNGSYIDSPDRIQNKKATINPIDDNKCFQYATSVALNHEEMRRNSQRMSKIKLFINNYNWKGIHYPSGKEDRKRLEKKNATIAF